MGQNENYASPVSGVTTNTQGTPEKSTLFSPGKKLGIALVGLGTYSHDQLAPALLETKYCKLSGLVTGNNSKTAEWKTKYGIPDANIYSYDNFDQIIDNPDIDIAYIVLPISLHAEYTIRAAKAGKHVICEKPMALTTEECDSMIDACKKAERLLAIGYRLHYDPYHNVIMKISREKIFGELNYIHAQHGVVSKGGWRLDKKMAGGGALMDLGIYCVHECRYVTGTDPIAVKANEYEQADLSGNAVEKTLSWEMEFPNGLMVKCETSYAGEMNLFHAKADHGWFELSPAFSYNGIAGKTATGFLNFPSVNQQALQMDDFALSILGNKEVKVTGESGKKDIQIIQAIYESMKTGKRIEIQL